jgi:hypothetical protein
MSGTVTVYGDYLETIWGHVFVEDCDSVWGLSRDYLGTCVCRARLEKVCDSLVFGS